VAGAINGTVAISITTGGTQLLNPANTNNDAAPITLNGGTFKTGTTTGTSEQVGSLKVDAKSTIELGTGSHDLKFAASNATVCIVGFLTIKGWNGNPGFSGTAGRFL
jgi:hypothetical protein